MAKLSELRNIGMTLERRLNEIGVADREALERLGAAKTYKLLAERWPGVQLPVCYNLYSLAATLQGQHWTELTEKEKKALVAEAKSLGCETR